jgi:hypothetical protein
MDDLEFEEMIGAFIDRPVSLDDEIPAELVFAMLDKAERPERAQDLESMIVGDRLVLSVPPGAAMPPYVREVEINLPGVRVIVSLEPTPT